MWGSSVQREGQGRVGLSPDIWSCVCVCVCVCADIWVSMSQERHLLAGDDGEVRIRQGEAASVEGKYEDWTRGEQSSE